MLQIKPNLIFRPALLWDDTNVRWPCTLERLEKKTQFPNVTDKEWEGVGRAARGVGRWSSEHRPAKVRIFEGWLVAAAAAAAVAVYSDLFILVHLTPFFDSENDNTSSTNGVSFSGFPNSNRPYLFYDFSLLFVFFNVFFFFFLFSESMFKTSPPIHETNKLDLK